MRTLMSPGTGTASRSLVSTGCDTSEFYTIQATIYTLQHLNSEVHRHSHPRRRRARHVVKQRLLHSRLWYNVMPCEVKQSRGR
jgi:hypothetical protein